MIISGNLINVIDREIYPARINIEGGIITRITRSDEAYENYIAPGFIDAHVHIESSMLVPSEFARIAVTHGTIAAVSDPHEIANVLGKEGVEFMIRNGKSVPFRFFFGAPSSVPATEFESSGAVLGLKETEDLLMRDDIYYLSEVMNYPAVIARDGSVLDKIEIARRLNKPIDGHAPGVVGRDLKVYASAGISTDHEAFTFSEAVEKIEAGMKILIREGSAARNLEALAPLFSKYPDKLMLCSDDIHPEMLMQRHINGLVKKLVERGYDLFDILRAVSLNPATHYGLDTGLLRIGDSADFIVIKDLREFEVMETWIAGNPVYIENKVMFSSESRERPNNFNATELTQSDIEVLNQRSRVRVISVKDGELYTTSFSARWSEDPILLPTVGDDILKLVVKERYTDDAPSVAFIHGFGMKRGAFASSVAHDSHNIIAVGVDDKSIIAAINGVIRESGGLAVTDGETTDVLPLPVAGIMSDVPCGTIAAEYLRLSDKVKDMGVYLKSPFMTLSFMALLVIPELKLGDRGLFDGLNFRFTSLFED